MGKVYTRFETKTAQKPYPIGRPKPNYSLYKGVPPPPHRVFSYPQSHRILYWIKSEERMKMFAGTDTEGSRDGLASLLNSANRQGFV